MSTYTGVYRAKALQVEGGVITAYVPQVFGDTPISITDVIGGLPTGPTVGWVLFESGWPEFPVWSSGVVTGDTVISPGGGANEVMVSTDEPTDPAVELWYDPDAPSPSTGVATVQAGSGISVNAADPTNPVVSAEVTQSEIDAINDYLDLSGAAPVTVTLAYTGSQQTFVVPPGVTLLTVAMKGASAGLSVGYNGAVHTVAGKGARLTGTIAVTPGESLAVFVGGKGGAGATSVAGTPGYNGGGAGRSFQATPDATGGGGGATDIRRGGTALVNRIVVAAGGGSAAARTAALGGDAGSTVGQDGMNDSGVRGDAQSGKGGTQSAGGATGSGGLPGSAGSLGQGGGGGGAGNAPCGAGGGGYYGGGGGSFNNPSGAIAGGGGGSCLIPSGMAFAAADVTTDGEISITYTPTDRISSLEGEVARLRASTGVLVAKSYRTGTDTFYSTTSGSFVDVDATNIFVTFTAPPSGRVLVSMRALALVMSSADMYFNLRDSGGDISNTSAIATASLSDATATFEQVVSGLVSGAAYTWKWGWKMSGGVQGRLYGGPTYGPFTMVVTAVP